MFDLNSLPEHSRARYMISHGLTACSQGHGTDFAWRAFAEIDCDLGIVIEPNNSIKFRLRCTECHCESADMPSRFGRELVAKGMTPSWSRQSFQDYPPCSYANCNAKPTEYHHFAPRNTFGDDAEQWPIMPLCRAHHQEWHRTMDGYRWHTRRTA